MIHITIADDRVNKANIFFAFYKSTFYKSSPQNTVCQALLLQLSKHWLMHTLFLKESSQVSCTRKNNDIYINSSLPCYLFYEKLINFSIFVIIYNLIRIL